MRDAFVSALSTLAAADPRVMLITGDLGFGVLTDFAARFPDQFINSGVAEQNMTGLAAGLALEGHKVYTYSIANFTTLRCLEQIRNDVCYHDLDVTIVSVGGGFSYGQLGMSHFATEDLAILRALPNLQVIAPADPWEAHALTLQMASQGGPRYLRIDKSQAGLPQAEIELGKVRMVHPGDDICIVAIGGILSEALVAAQILAGKGVGARVLAVHCLKPLEAAPIIAAARETRGIVTVEEHNIVGGLAGAVAEICLEANAPPASFARIGVRDQFPTVVGDQQFLRESYGLAAGDIVAASLAVAAG